MAVLSLSFSPVHNHPSGSTVPSRPDIEITQKLNKAAELLGLTFADHITIGAKGTHYSFMEVYSDLAKVQ